MFGWPTWGCGVSKFPWSYGENETCYVLEGRVVVTPDGEAVVAAAENARPPCKAQSHAVKMEVCWRGRGTCALCAHVEWGGGGCNQYTQPTATGVQCIHTRFTATWVHSQYVLVPAGIVVHALLACALPVCLPACLLSCVSTCVPDSPPACWMCAWACRWCASGDTGRRHGHIPCRHVLHVSYRPGSSSAPT